MTINHITALLSKNNAAEQEAIEGYFVLLEAVKENQLPMELYKDIQEIISDEMNHSDILEKWVIALSKIQPNKT